MPELVVSIPAPTTRRCAGRRCRRRGRVAAALLLIVVISCVAYWPSMQGSLHLDDFDMLVNNNLAQLTPRTIISTYPTRWLVVLSLWANARLHGTDVAGYHIVNLVLHTANAWLVCVLTWRLWRLARRRYPRAAMVPAPHAFGVITALIFAVHPLQTQAVVYITQRFMLAAALWYLTALWLLTREYWLGRRRWLGWGLAGVATLAGAICKESVITVPAVAIALVWFWIAAPRWRVARWRHWLGLTAVLLILVAVPLIYFLHLSHWDTRTIRRNLSGVGGPVSVHDSALTHVTYTATQPRVLVRYLGLMLWPRGLSVDHAVRITTTWRDPALWLAVALLAALVLLCWFARRTVPWCWWGIIMIMVPLLPQSSIVPSPDVMFEHRTYLSMAGFAWCLTGAGSMLMARLHAGLRRGVGAIVLVYLVCLAIGTRQRCAVWHDELSLWHDAFTQAPFKQRVVVNYANALLENGAVNDAIALLTTRIDAWGAAMPHAVALLGNAYLQQGDLDRAWTCYQAALAPGYREGQIAYNAAVVLERLGRYRAALRLTRELAQRTPGNADAWYFAGRLAATLPSERAAAIHDLQRYVGLVQEGPRAALAQQLLALLTNAPTTRATNFVWRMQERVR